MSLEAQTYAIEPSEFLSKWAIRTVRSQVTCSFDLLLLTLGV
jgi:hypothetical protein